METSINNQSGGIAAETTNINSNPEPPCRNKMKDNPNSQTQETEGRVTLKDVAAQFKAYPGTLKYNIKKGNLPATQENPQSPYLVKPSDVEKLLRASPGIESIFHPEKPRPPAEVNASTADWKPNEAVPASAPAGKHEPASEPKPPMEATAAAATHVEQPGDNTRPGADDVNPSAQALDDVQSSRPRKRRRRGRGRGKSRDTTPSNPSSVHSLALKALNGSSPEERLRITACLNELAGLVASV